MKPDPYQRQKSRQYQAKARARGGSTAAGGSTPTGTQRGRGGARRGTGGRSRGPPLESNAFRFQETDDAQSGQTDNNGTDVVDLALEEKALRKMLDDALDINHGSDGFFKLKEEQDWGVPGDKSLRAIDQDFEDVDFARLRDLVNLLPLPERLGFDKTGESASG